MTTSEQLKWAQGLIEQLPKDHDGRNSYLLNHGTGIESQCLRVKRVVNDAQLTNDQKVKKIMALMNAKE